MTTVKDNRSPLTFAETLALWGPHATGEPLLAGPLTLDDAKLFCESLAASHYENFTVVSFLLPKSMRQEMSIVYAYCRTADDLSDEIEGQQQSLALLEWWEEELRRGVAGETVRHPVLLATADLIRQHDLTLEPFLDLLVAFRRDQNNAVRVATFDALLNYCCYSANPVGRIILELATSVSGTHTPSEEMLQWSDSICTGLQLVNHWQDVARDLAIGRCYIPQEIFDSFGYRAPATLDEALLQEDDPQQRLAFRAMMKFLVDDAVTRLRSGQPLVAAVPREIRFDVSLFVLGGLAVADAIRKIDYNVWQTRPTVSRLAKMRLFVVALWQTAVIWHRRRLLGR
ncbi:MAG: squalene synthase HpnC [Thermoguttaceae bacterium]